MIQFKDHEIRKDNNDYVEIILHLDSSTNFFEEFSKELGQQDDKLEIQKAAQSYVKKNLPNTKFNKIKVMVGGVVVATMLGATLVVPGGNLASAETGEENITNAAAATGEVAITGGQLAVDQLTVGTFSTVTLEGKIQESFATIDNFNIADPSGIGAGWNVVMSATQFTDSSTGHTLPKESLKVSAPNISISETGSSPANNINTREGTIDSDTGVKILSAPEGSGMGTYTVSFDPNSLELELLPKDVKAGTYTSTISVEITNGP